MNWPDAYREILTERRPLGELTTWKIGGTARWFLEPRDAAETARLMRTLAENGMGFRVLGGGANLLIDDGDHAIPILHPSRMADVTIDGETVLAGAGASFSGLVADTTTAGLEGLDVLAGIPGRMGGICAMNAGGRYGEIKDVVTAVEFVTATGEILEFTPAEVGFSYRATKLPPGMITRVRMRLRRAADPVAPRKNAGRILKEKSATQPLQEPSGGCCFKNPPGGSTGQIVDQLGLKGHRIGDAEISTRHGNFIVNKGCATFADTLQLMELVENRVREATGFTLAREVKIWRSEDRPG